MTASGLSLNSGRIKDRTIIKVASTLLVFALLLASACSDHDGASSGNPSKPACQLISQTTSGTGKSDGLTYTYTFVFTITYDGAGNVTQQLYTYDYKYSDGKTATSVSKQSYQFDDKGFQTQRASQYNSTDKDGKSTAQTGNEVFTYENGLLSKDASTYMSDGKTTTYTFLYEYDDKGRVVKLTNSTDNSSTKIVYNGDIVQSITKTDGVGNMTSPFVQYNSKGQLIKTIETYGGTSDEFRYEYDAEGSITRQERYINAKPSSASSYEYDTKENPSAYAYINTKGIPTVPSTRPDFSTKHNYTSIKSFEANAALTGFEPSTSTLYTYDYNTQNFPTGYTSQNLDKAGVQTSTSLVSYEYSNCK